MSHSTEATRSVVIERFFSYPPAKLWRALTDRSLLEQWLMKNDFEPAVGSVFQFRADPVPNWDGVIACKVLIVEPMKRLAYTWSSMGLESVVLFTIEPQGDGTFLRMEHSGFREDQEAAYRGANYGWQSFFGRLELVLGAGAV